MLNKSKDLVPFKDKVFIYLGKKKGWRPQLSVLNCNKARVWQLLTLPKESTFHYIERTHLKETLIYNLETEKFVEFQPDIHTPESW